MIVFLLVFLLTGCTKQLKDANGKVVKNEATKQVLVENVLCKPEELADKYKEVTEQKKLDYKKMYEDGDISKKDRKKLLNIKKLYIFSRNLKVLPKEIENLINIEELIIGDYIVGGTIKKLPKEIGNLTNLKRLEISCHKLKELPKEICNLTNLKELLINCNNLEELPKDIGNLTKLKRLTIRCDKLDRLPKEIGNFIKLEYILIGSKSLKVLPKEIGNLKKT